MYKAGKVAHCTDRVTAASCKPDKSADIQQEGIDGAEEYDSDSDDARPLGDLVKAMDPSQLAAKRTPFLAAAQTATSELSDDAVHAER